MTSERHDMSTDEAWEEWGRRDAYFGMITDNKYRRSQMTEESRREFFQSGEVHVRYLIDTIHRHIDPEFKPKSILDFGCGVGRLLVPFAAIAEQVVGLDVSPSMLVEAKRNCDERQLQNVTLMASDDELSALTDVFDLIHSYIVFQHIPARRGLAIVSRLIERLCPGGIGAIHLTYSKTAYAATHGIAPPAQGSPEPPAIAPPIDPDPEMQMNCYGINEILYSMQSRGVSRVRLDFTDHGGELGSSCSLWWTGRHLSLLRIRIT